MNGSYALMGTSAIIRHVQHLVFKIAENHTTVLLTGEQGTGKEIIAKIIHDRSTHNPNSFTIVKCHKPDEKVLEMELFGCEQTGKTGVFTRGTCGTIYLDEVGQLTMRMQALLFRMLQEGGLHTLGTKTDTPVQLQIRLICSTSVDLELLVRKGTFREDLFYKLSASSIYLPSLRERREDVPILSDYFVQKYNQLKSKKIIGISHDAMNAMLQNSWNGNIQELENLIERIVVLKNTGSIEICDLPPRLRSLVTDNIDAFYDGKADIPLPHNLNMSVGNVHFSQNNNFLQMTKNNHNSTNLNLTQTNQSNFHRSNTNMPNHNTNQNSQDYHHQQSNTLNQPSRNHIYDEIPSEIDQFIKKEIDLGSGIDFYRVVEEFENRLISEALRRTNHNKNRAAQLLSMNRTTLVEKLKKRASSSSIKSETGKVKRNSAFTIFDGLGNETQDFNGIDFINMTTEDTP